MPEVFRIFGKKRLKGKIEISGYKNSAGAILAGVLLSEKESIIDNLPLCTDVLDQIKILEKIGARIEWLDKKKIKIWPKDIDPEKIPVSLFEKMRISVLLIAPLLARFKKIRVPHPGGDKIGLRPIQAHLDVFRSFGVKIEEDGRFYHFESPHSLRPTKIVLKEFSVTATENALMMASVVPFKTKIEICASEPQVQDLGKFLQKMGVKIRGLGSHSIEVQGRKRLSGAVFRICPDWSEVGTFLIALGITGGVGEIKNVVPQHLTLFLEKMREIGLNFKIMQNKIVVREARRFKATKIQILPHPGFPTDLQPQTSVLLTQAEGKSIIHDPLFENRFQHLFELRKMGADVEITDPHRALIFGKKELKGNKVVCSDIRAGASLVIAGLIAQGETIVENIEQIDRGYEGFEVKLSHVGANIERIKREG